MPCDSGIQDETCRWVHVAWHESSTAEVRIFVYAVTVCIHPDGGPCVVLKDAPKLIYLALVTTAPAADGSCDFKMRPESTDRLDSFLGPGGRGVYAYLLYAVNWHGGSAPAIAATEVH